MVKLSILYYIFVLLSTHFVSYRYPIHLTLFIKSYNLRSELFSSDTHLSFFFVTTAVPFLVFKLVTNKWERKKEYSRKDARPTIWP